MNINDQTTKNTTSPSIKASLYQRAMVPSVLLRTTLSLFMLAVTVILSACSPATSTPNSPSSAPATILPSQTAAPTATTAVQPTAVPVSPTAASTPQQGLVTTSLDPCTLISSQDVSTLTGATFGQGVEGAIPGGLKTCTYVTQPTNTFVVEVGQASDVSTAQAYKNQFISDIQANAQQLASQGLNVTQVPNFADGAVSASANVSVGGISVSASAFGFLKGKTFVGFSDTALGGTATSSAAMQSEATTILGKLP